MLPFFKLNGTSTCTRPRGRRNSDNSRARVCDSTFSVHLSDTSVGNVDCDEFAMASTHESGGYPKS